MGRKIVISLALAVVTWAGLIYLVMATDPWALEPRRTVVRLLFLALFFLALSFTLYPPFLLIESRRGEGLGQSSLRPGRRGGLVALFFALCAWLRMSEALNWTNVLLLLAAVILTELLLVVRGG